ncbi:hypothetical protein [Phytohalomonas tamaricis]|uniref:hypothetical protein n=1 Tax=Phytohalomonas tamaricis TaxID=2081032 RepID=UPI000D0B2F5D|nr:hypothetical protein [Phytohalomonas tamaricis]
MLNMVGVEQDRLSKILKDTNDRVGDSLNTGYIEMTDFFAKIAPQSDVVFENYSEFSGGEAMA